MARQINRLNARAVATLTENGRHADGGGLYLSDRNMSSCRRYLLMDLFAGCGGMTRGFVDTGRFEPIFAVEMDEHAAAT